MNTTRSGAVLSQAGVASSTIFNLGPGRLGTLLESIAIPEIRQQAVELAATLAERVATPQNSDRVGTASPMTTEPFVLAAA